MGEVEVLAATIRAGLDAVERQARDRLCISCGLPTRPLRNALGVTGYTHDRERGGWDGRRCPGSVTGAEPVQRPERVLARVASLRALLDDLLAEPHLPPETLGHECPAELPVTGACDCGRDGRLARRLRLLAGACGQEET